MLLVSSSMLVRMLKNWLAGPTLPAPDASRNLPPLPPEVRARVLDFVGDTRNYMQLAHTDGAWRASALDPVTLGRHLQRCGCSPHIANPRAQRRQIERLLTAEAVLRGRTPNVHKRWHSVSPAAYDASRAQAVTAPSVEVAGEGDGQLVRYAANGAWAVRALGHHQTQVEIWCLGPHEAHRVAVLTIEMTLSASNAAISDDGNRVVVQGPQQDFLLSRAHAQRGDAYRVTPLFDFWDAQWRNHAPEPTAATCALAPSGRWLILGNANEPQRMALWRLDNVASGSVDFTSPALRDVRQMFFSADETRLYFQRQGRHIGEYFDFTLASA